VWCTYHNCRHRLIASRIHCCYRNGVRPAIAAACAFSAKTQLNQTRLVVDIVDAEVEFGVSVAGGIGRFTALDSHIEVDLPAAIIKSISEPQPQTTLSKKSAPSN